MIIIVKNYFNKISFFKDVLLLVFKGGGSERFFCSMLTIIGHENYEAGVSIACKMNPEFH